MNKITGYQNRPVQLGVENKVSRNGETTKASVAPFATAGGSPIRITDQAKQLATLEQALQSLPAVNESRVAEIQLAIEEGRYQIDPSRIADKLLRLEQELSA